MPNNERSVVLIKFDQMLKATDKIDVYNADIQDVFTEDEKKFQRKHPEITDNLAIIAEINQMLRKAINTTKQQI